MESNPYTSPSANLFGSTGGTAVESVPHEAIEKLQGTKPWVRLIGVIMWLAVIFMLLGGAGMAVIGIMGPASGTQGGLNAPAMIGMAIGYAVVALFYIYPTIKIWKYGSYIGKLVNSRSAEDLVAALDQQRSFWKFVGILFLISIVIYILVIIAFVAFGFAAGAGNLRVPAQ